MLVTPDGGVKLCDFGTAKFTKSPLPFTKRVTTRYYRSPEMLFDSDSYTASIDIWGCGCILAEMLLGEPIFKGTTDIEQLGKIMTVLGTPLENDWKEAE